MDRASRSYLVVSISILLSMMVSFAQATDIRGRVDGVHAWAKEPFPMEKAVVEVLREKDGADKIFQITETNSTGMYYFKGLAPGDYVLRVNGLIKVSVTIVDKKNQDIGPILFPY